MLPPPTGMWEKRKNWHMHIKHQLLNYIQPLGELMVKSTNFYTDVAAAANTCSHSCRYLFTVNSIQEEDVVTSQSCSKQVFFQFVSSRLWLQNASLSLLLVVVSRCADSFGFYWPCFWDTTRRQWKMTKTKCAFSEGYNFHWGCRNTAISLCRLT